MLETFASKEFFVDALYRPVFESTKVGNPAATDIPAPDIITIFDFCKISEQRAETPFSLIFPGQVPTKDLAP